MSFYKTRNPAFALLLSIIENFLSRQTAIGRKKHVSLIDTRKVTQCGSKETQRKKSFLHLYFLYKILCSFVVSI